jgi:hypothetical protein
MPASLAYDSLITDMGGASPAVDFVTGFFKLMLVAGYSPNQGVDMTRADVSNEVVGAGYVAGGLPAVATFNLDPVAHLVTVLMQNVHWTGANTFTATGAVLYQSYGGPPSGDPLICYIDFGGAISCSAGPFTVAVSAPLTFTNTTA